MAFQAQPLSCIPCAKRPRSPSLGGGDHLQPSSPHRSSRPGSSRLLQFQVLDDPDLSAFETQDSTYRPELATPLPEPQESVQLSNASVADISASKSLSTGAAPPDQPQQPDESKTKPKEESITQEVIPEDEYLKRLNFCERDTKISMTVADHKYTIIGFEHVPWKSGSTLIKELQPPFDGRGAIANMKPANRRLKYPGMTDAQILAKWANQNEGSTASADGTALHRVLELFWNRVTIPQHIADTKEIQYFRKFLSEWKPFASGEVEIYRTEWQVWYPEVGLCGTIDGVLCFRGDPTKIILFDWKRAKDELATQTNKWENFYAPVSWLQKTHKNAYSLQLNLYATILRSPHYQRRVVGLYLLRLHPDAASYELLQVPNMQREVTAILKWRVEQLKVEAEAQKENEFLTKQGQQNFEEETTESLSSEFIQSQRAAIQQHHFRGVHQAQGPPFQRPPRPAFPTGHLYQPFQSSSSFAPPSSRR